VRVVQLGTLGGPGAIRHLKVAVLKMSPRGILGNVHDEVGVTRRTGPVAESQFVVTAFVMGIRHRVGGGARPGLRADRATDQSECGHSLEGDASDVGASLKCHRVPLAIGDRLSRLTRNHVPHTGGMIVDQDAEFDIVTVPRQCASPGR